MHTMLQLSLFSCWSEKIHACPFFFLFFFHLTSISMYSDLIEALNGLFYKSKHSFYNSVLVHE